MSKETQPVDLWEQLARGLLRPCTTKSNDANGKAKLALLPKPEARHEPQVPREAARITFVIRDVMRDVCRGVKPWPLLLYGSYGIGKTCAGLVLADYVKQSLWFDFGDFCRKCNDAQCDRLYWTFGGDSDEGHTNLRQSRKVTWDEWWKVIRAAPLLVLDDIGTRTRASDAQYEALKLAFDRRLGKPFLLTSNLDIDAIGKLFDGRIADRLLAGTEATVAGNSMRWGKR